MLRILIITITTVWSVDDISLVSFGQDSQSEVDTTKYESEPVVEDVEEANNNNSDNPYDDVEVKEENEEPPYLIKTKSILFFQEEPLE